MTTEIFFRKYDLRWAKSFKSLYEGKCRLSGRPFHKGDLVVKTTFSIGKGADSKEVTGYFSRKTVTLVTGGSLFTLVNDSEGVIMCPTGWHIYSYHQAKALLSKVEKEGKIVSFATRDGQLYDFVYKKGLFEAQGRTWTVQQVMSFMYPIKPFLVGFLR